MNPTHGKLILTSGLKEIVILNDKPFALLQSKKSEMIKEGYKKENLKIYYKL